MLFIAESEPFLMDALEAVLAGARARVGCVSESESESEFYPELAEIQGRVSELRDSKGGPLGLEPVSNWLERNVASSCGAPWSCAAGWFTRSAPTLQTVLGTRSATIRFALAGGGVISFCRPALRSRGATIGVSATGSAVDDMRVRSALGPRRGVLPVFSTRLKLRGVAHDARRGRTAAIARALCAPPHPPPRWWHAARAPTAALLLRAVRHARLRASRAGVEGYGFLWRSDAPAAATIQAAVRGGTVRAAMRPLVVARCIARRAIVALSRWWRNVGCGSLKRRHAQLSAWKRVASMPHGDTLYIEPELYYFLVSGGGAGARGVDGIRPPPPLGAQFRINAQHQVVLASPLGLVAPEKAGFRPTSCSGNRLARVVAAFSPPRHNGGSRSGMTRGSARALLTTNVDVPHPCPGVCIPV